MRVILASGSPRRKELLQLIVPKFDTDFAFWYAKLVACSSTVNPSTNVSFTLHALT